MASEQFFAMARHAGALLCAFASFPLLLPAQLDTDRTAGGGLVSGPQKEKPAKNLITMEELTSLDQKFRGELDAAHGAADQEKFADAEQQFTQLLSEVDDLLKRIAGAVFQKNSFVTVDGVKKPASIQVETEWYTGIRDKAERGKAEAAALGKVTAVQKQADDLLKAKKYPEDLETYRKAAELLAENKTQIRDDPYRYVLGRLVNGENESATTYWGDEYARLRDQYNKSTDDKLTPAQVHGIIQGVLNEITDKGYLDPARHPDMPDDARNLFRSLSEAAQKYLSQ